MERYKFQLLGLSVMWLIGCASVAHRPYACERVMNKSYPLSPFYFLMGATLQQGDCAIIEPLKIETGQYYYYSSKNILADLKKGPNREFGAINSFSRVFNCSEKAAPYFVDMVIYNKDEIFGENLEKGSRTVTMNIQKKIKEDSFLSNECRF